MTATSATDGSGTEQLGDSELDAWSPAFSPDGWWIAFVAGNYDDDRGLFMIDREGNGLRRMSHQTGGQFSREDNLVRWSPDGEFVMADAGTGDTVETRVFRVDGGQEVPITGSPSLGTGEYASWGAEWSPDGERIAYSRVTNVGRIVIVDADGSDPQLVEGVELDAYSNLAWAPDGSRLLAWPALETNDTEKGFVIIDPSGQRPPIGIPAEGGWNWQRVAE